MFTLPKFWPTPKIGITSRFGPISWHETRPVGSFRKRRGIEFENEKWKRVRFSRFYGPGAERRERCSKRNDRRSEPRKGSCWQLVTKESWRGWMAKKIKNLFKIVITFFANTVYIFQIPVEVSFIEYYTLVLFKLWSWFNDRWLMAERMCNKK